MIASRADRWLIGVCALVCGCATSPPRRPAAGAGATTVTAATSVPTGAAISRGPSPADEVRATGRAHALVIQATSCWLGGLWSDAVAEVDEIRDAGIRRRCEDLLRAVGASPEAKYYPLRAVDPATVDEIAARVGEVAKADPADSAHAAELAALLRAVAAASRETIDARRAADAVKELPDSASVTDRRMPKVVGAPELRQAQALRALHRHDGPYAGEAHVIATLDALDRMEIAHGLPKHLKIDAVEGACLEVFGVRAPPLSSDGSAPISSGTWLDYLTRVASAAGHPVPNDARDPQNREPLAWNGVLEGFADRLRHARAGSSRELDAVARSVVRRIDRQAENARAAFDALAPAAR